MDLEKLEIEFINEFGEMKIEFKCFWSFYVKWLDCKHNNKKNEKEKIKFR